MHQSASYQPTQIKTKPATMQEPINKIKKKPFKDPVTRQDVGTVVKQAFGRNTKIAKYHVQSYSAEKLGFLGSHRHLVVTIVRPNSDEKEIHAFFVKSMPYDIEEQALVIEDSKAFFKETNFYNHIVPELTGSVKDMSWLPRCYLVKKDALIFEDLKSRNLILNGHFLDLRSFKASLSALANLHASSLLAEKRLGNTFDVLHPDLIKESLFDKEIKFYDWYRTSVDVSVAVAKQLGLDHSRLERFCEQIFQKIKASKKYRNVLCHGDLKSFNMMFDNASTPPKCVLVDFQLIRYCPAMADVSQMLYLATRRELRDKHEEEILRHYHESLCKSLRENSKDIAVPSLDEITQEFKDMRLVGVVTASLYFPIQHLEGKRCAEMTADSDGFAKLLFGDRVQLVLNTMKDDRQYGEIVKEITTELVQRSLEFSIL